MKCDVRPRLRTACDRFNENDHFDVFVNVGGSALRFDQLNDKKSNEFAYAMEVRNHERHWFMIPKSSFRMKHDDDIRAALGMAVQRANTKQRHTQNGMLSKRVLLSKDLKIDHWATGAGNATLLMNYISAAANGTEKEQMHDAFSAHP